jgi:hypothetical protein
MLAHSPRDRSRSPRNTNGTSSIKQLHHDNTSNEIESTSNSKTKKENESQQRMKNLKVN